MSDFIEWFDDMGAGIYYDPRSQEYSSTLSDLAGVTFNSLEGIREWLAKEKGIEYIQKPDESSIEDIESIITGEKDDRS